MRVIDLFSGRGGFSQAFLDRGHNVIRYDYDEQFKDVPNTIIQDVLELNYLRADVILASIDCTHLTYANAHPDKKGLELSRRLAKHTLKVIHKSKPVYWCIENPEKSRLWRIIGKPTFVTAWGYWGMPYLKPTGLLGQLPLIDWRYTYDEPQPKDTWNRERYNKNKFSYLAPRAAEKRSLIPYEFSLAFCLAAEGSC